MIQFHSLYVTSKQDYLHSIYFHPFPFLNFKTSNQGYLIPFFSIPFSYLGSVWFNVNRIPRVKWMQGKVNSRKENEIQVFGYAIENSLKNDFWCLVTF